MASDTGGPAMNLSAGSDDSKDTTPLHCEPSSPDIAMHQDADEPTAEAPHKSISNDSKVTKHKRRTPLQNTSMDIHKLAVIFKNPILLSSFVRNFERKDYAMLAQLAASMPGVQAWPQWDPLSQPWPAGELPFHIGDLAAKCNNLIRSPRRLVAKGPSTAELTECEWTPTGMLKDGKSCSHTAKDQGLRLRPGPHNETLLEKVPLEFFECTGYKMKIMELPSIRDHQPCVSMGLRLSKQLDIFYERMPAPTEIFSDSLKEDTLNDTSVLDEMHKYPHGAGFLICSKCARENYMTYSICLWIHERMIPICRDCCDSPRSKQYRFKGTPATPSIAENIRNFSRGNEYLECDCCQNLSPEQGYHSCGLCQLMLATIKYQQVLLNLQKVYPRTVSSSVCEIGDPLEHLGRNYCPCGKDWNQIVQSWNGFTQEERDKKMYRMCMLCTGHIPRNKIMTAKPTNCL